jgi:hypothetical protein
MNSLYANTPKRATRGSLIFLAVVLCLVGPVLFLQSLKFLSGLGVLLTFAYDDWQRYLWSMLRALEIWAGATGLIFAIQFAVTPAGHDPRKLLVGFGVGFVVEFTFSNLTVVLLGLIIFIPLGIASLFIPGIIKFATLDLPGWRRPTLFSYTSRWIRPGCWPRSGKR